MHTHTTTPPRSRAALIIRLSLYAVITVACWSALNAVYGWRAARSASRTLPAAARILNVLHTAGYAVGDPDSSTRLLTAVGRGETVLPRTRPVYMPLTVDAVRRISFARVPVYEFSVPGAVCDSVFTAVAGVPADRLYLFALPDDSGRFPAPVVLGQDGTLDTLTGADAAARRQAWFDTTVKRFVTMVTFPLPDAFRHAPVDRISVRPGHAFRGMALHRAGDAKDAWIPLRFNRTVAHAVVPFALGGSVTATPERRSPVAAPGRYAGFSVLLVPDSAATEGEGRVFRVHDSRPEVTAWNVQNLPTVPGVPGARLLHLQGHGSDSTLFFDIRPAQGRITVVAAAAEGAAADASPSVPGFTVTEAGMLQPDDSLAASLNDARWHAGSNEPGITLPGSGAGLGPVYAPPVSLMILRILLAAGAAGAAARLWFRAGRSSA